MKHDKRSGERKKHLNMKASKGFASVSDFQRSQGWGVVGGGGKEKHSFQKKKKKRSPEFSVRRGAWERGEQAPHLFDSNDLDFGVVCLLPSSPSTL